MSPHHDGSPSGGAAFLFSLADVPVPLVFATHRIIRDCNEEFAALFGFSRAELLETSFARLYPELCDFVRAGRMWHEHLAGGRLYRDERIMKNAGGQRFWCKVDGRSRRLADPFAEALYRFEPLNRPISGATLALTGRQRQVLALVARGRTSAEIAAETGLSRRTVEAHRLRLSRTVGVRNSTELVAWFLAENPERLSPGPE